MIFPRFRYHYNGRCFVGFCWFFAGRTKVLDYLPVVQSVVFYLIVILEFGIFLGHLAWMLIRIMTILFLCDFLKVILHSRFDGYIDF